jgi:hypothetical protein
VIATLGIKIKAKKILYQNTIKIYDIVLG